MWKSVKATIHRDQFKSRTKTESRVRRLHEFKSITYRRNER